MSHMEMERREFLQETAKQMSQPQLEHMERSLTSCALSKNAADLVWLKAFGIYNKETGENLSTHCSPCYMKVLMYFKKQAHV